MDSYLVIWIGLVLLGLGIGSALIFCNMRRENSNLREQADSNEGRLKAIFENAPAEIYLKDDEGRYLMINPQFEKLFNVKNSEVFGLLPTDIHDPELGAKTRAHDLRVLNERATVVRDELALTEIGLRTLHTIKFPTFDSSGELTGLGAIVTDVTDLRHAEQDLRQSQKMDAIGHLTGGVAHDFNNLLAIIKGNLELHGLLEDEKEKKECIEIALKATGRGADLTRNLLSFAKKAPLSPAAFDIDDLIEETSDWSSRVLPDNIIFNLDQLNATADVFADKSMAQSALLNVILNAKDAMPEGGEISVETFAVGSHPDADTSDVQAFESGAYVCVRISDTGVGIPAENLEKVFTPFYTTKPAGTRSGLGLSMVQGFMKQSGGTVSISSEINVGTTVDLYFRAANGHTQEDAEAVTPFTPLRGKKGRILLAEDNDDVRTWITRLLELFGHDVVSAPTGDSAYTLYKENNEGYDLLITDILMPGKLQGPSLADEIRKITPKLPVIFLSGYPRDELIGGGDYLSGDVFLMKPVSADTLKEAVHHSLDK